MENNRLSLIVPILAALAVAYVSVGFFIGATNSITPATQYEGAKLKECEYPNLFSYSNPGYVIICELARPRFR